MPAIIGGSPSTGTSVLVNVLNRHSQIYAGPETHLFTKPELYTDWNKHKSKILRPSWKGLKSPGIHRYNGVILNDEDAWRHSIQESQTFQGFADTYFLKAGKSYWVEKTPANTYCFNLFLNQFDNAKVILMIRNPYDAVASMIARGISLARSCALYLANTLANFDLNKSDDYHVVKYESLVEDSQATITELCQFLGFEFEEQMLQGDDKVEKMAGWKQNEFAPISAQSKNRFSELEENQREDILNALASIRLISGKWPFEKVEQKSIKDICELFDYKYLHSPTKKKPQSLFIDKMISTLRYYPTNLFNYPVTFS